jgi:hypothetical protein
MSTSSYTVEFVIDDMASASIYDQRGSRQLQERREPRRQTIALMQSPQGSRENHYSSKKLFAGFMVFLGPTEDTSSSFTYYRFAMPPPRVVSGDWDSGLPESNGTQSSINAGFTQSGTNSTLPFKKRLRLSNVSSFSAGPKASDVECSDSLLAALMTTDTPKMLLDGASTISDSERRSSHLPPTLFIPASMEPNNVRSSMPPQTPPSVPRPYLQTPRQDSVSRKSAMRTIDRLNSFPPKPSEKEDEQSVAVPLKDARSPSITEDSLELLLPKTLDFCQCSRLHFPSPKVHRNVSRGDPFGRNNIGSEIDPGQDEHSQRTSIPLMMTQYSGHAEDTVSDSFVSPQNPLRLQGDEASVNLKGMVEERTVHFAPSLESSHGKHDDSRLEIEVGDVAQQNTATPTEVLQKLDQGRLQSKYAAKISTHGTATPQRSLLTSKLMTPSSKSVATTSRPQLTAVKSNQTQRASVNKSLKKAVKKSPRSRLKTVDMNETNNGSLQEMSITWKVNDLVWLRWRYGWYLVGKIERRLGSSTRDLWNCRYMFQNRLNPNYVTCRTDDLIPLYAIGHGDAVGNVVSKSKFKVLPGTLHSWSLAAAIVNGNDVSLVRLAGSSTIVPVKLKQLAVHGNVLETRRTSTTGHLIAALPTLNGKEPHSMSDKHTPTKVGPAPHISLANHRGTLIHRTTPAQGSKKATLAHESKKMMTNIKVTLIDSRTLNKATSINRTEAMTGEGEGQCRRIVALTGKAACRKIRDQLASQAIVVVDSIDSAVDYVVTDNVQKRTAKMLLARVLGIPIVPLSQLSRLPELESRPEAAWMPLIGKTVHLVGDQAFVHEWTPIVEALGATLLDVKEEHGGGCHLPSLMIIVKQRASAAHRADDQDAVVVVTAAQLAQCILHRTPFPRLVE